MADKINGQGYRPLDLTRTSGKSGVDEGQGATRSARGSQATGDQVSLTSSGLLLGRLEEIVAAAPVVNSERVDAIRQALASGAYEVDPRSLADRIVKFERDLV